jgi:hypothetical protein
MIRFDETTRILWIAADTVDDAKTVYEDGRHQIVPITELRGIVLEGSDGIYRMIRNRDAVIEFIQPNTAGLKEMMLFAEQSDPIRVEVAIYCRTTGCVCFAWKNTQSLTLWKTETQQGETPEIAANRLLAEIVPSPVSPVAGHLWTAEFDGEPTHFFMAYVEQEMEIDDGIWIKPSALSSFRLDRSMVAAFANSPSLAKLIRRSPA